MAESYAWLLVLGSVLLCSLFKMLLPTLSSLMAKLLQKDGETELQMRIEIGNMKQELTMISMMDEFARYARLERKINKMTDKLKTHGTEKLVVDFKKQAAGKSKKIKTRTAQLAKIKWVVNIAFYIVQAVLMISLILKYYSEPVAMLPRKWMAPLERMVAFPTGIEGGVGITCWLLVCNKVVAVALQPFG
ncbi:guided entry of tail-anchored proteins factor 1 isoform X2 [Scyliorhinus torazame]|uniref:guided entry of tail-anchored proteins factor 1 isoform X2 n=1 Tax=Scyliorhinus torazame TaxID=75743 RepID=UPI003B5AE221